MKEINIPEIERGKPRVSSRTETSFFRNYNVWIKVEIVFQGNKIIGNMYRLKLVPEFYFCITIKFNMLSYIFNNN